MAAAAATTTNDDEDGVQNYCQPKETRRQANLCYAFLQEFFISDSLSSSDHYTATTTAAKSTDKAIIDGVKQGEQQTEEGFWSSAISYKKYNKV